MFENFGSLFFNIFFPLFFGTVTAVFQTLFASLLLMKWPETYSTFLMFIEYMFLEQTQTICYIFSNF